jgi:hypothetical protein
MTLYFPQLATGTAGQFPITKIHQRRTVVNHLADGSELRLSDPDAAAIAWEIEYRGLSDIERTTLTDFFAAVRGRLGSFVFLDPCGNLLAHSEDLANSAWECDPMLRIEPADGYTRLVNTAQVSQSLAQTVPAPASYRFCGSAELRAAERTPVQLWIGSEGAHIESEVLVNDRWTVAACSGQMEAESESLTFGFVIPAGAVIEVSGVQLEAQPGRSGHRRTAAGRTGVPRGRNRQSFDYAAAVQPREALRCRLFRN